MDPNGGLRPRQLLDWIRDAVPLDDRWRFVRGATGRPLPDQPDRLVVVTMTGGPGLYLEGAYDRLTFQVLCRGDQAAQDEADDAARIVDGVLLTADMPTIDGVPTLGFSRVGGPPTPMAEDNGERPQSVCNYTITAASIL